MKATITPHPFRGEFRIPASKSHTIRRLIIASLGEGTTDIEYPLDSLDTRSCISVCRAMGAAIEEYYANDPLSPNPPDAAGNRLVGLQVRSKAGPGGAATGQGFPLLDVGNSGTTLFLALAAASLSESGYTFTGDASIATRSAGPLLGALKSLGVEVSASPEGCTPISVRGPWRGGKAVLPSPTSQYLSALLIAAPLAPKGTVTEVEVPLLNERPYIEMTLSYLKTQNVEYECKRDFSWFRIPGGAVYAPQNGPVPGDFSSAAFPVLAAALSADKPVAILGLDPQDSQGDKEFLAMLETMGGAVAWEQDSTSPLPRLLVSRSASLHGGSFDLNDYPDILPALAVLSVYAQGETVLHNVAHARLKETDRIAVMAQELSKLGAAVEERPDGLIIHGGVSQGLSVGDVDSHDDHRICMAFAAGAMGASGPISVSGAESAAVTYPGFLELLDAQIE